MTEPLPIGLYESLVTPDIRRKLRDTEAAARLAAFGEMTDARWIDAVSALTADTVRRCLAEADDNQRMDIANRVLTAIDPEVQIEQRESLDEIYEDDATVRALPGHEGRRRQRPGIPLSQGALITNAKGEPNLAYQLDRELHSADRVDLLCAFVKFSGINVLRGRLARLRERKVPFRVLTTTYMGATERRALDILVREFGAEVKVSYERSRTRLHAKAWLFERESGFTTAYIGSSNLSHAAIVEGLEWNIRLSSVAQADEIRKFRTTFDSYWNDPTFEDYDPDRDGDRLDAALAEARGWEREATAPRPGHLALVGQATDQDGHAGGARESAELSPRLPGLTARPHQQKILDLLDVQRTHHDRHTNLVVAATGTGKTVIAALDYARLVEEAGRPLRLLFVAHRDEILRQARSTFRSALADGTFGELFVGGEKPRRWDHVFASIQSLNTLDDAAFSRPWGVVILDECHHAEAASYQRLLTRVTWTELLGLTATPERADGVDIVKYFGGRVTAEVRLWDALSDNLLCPFHYFGIADQTDLRNVSWDARGGYSIKGLEEVYTADTIRAQIIVKQLRNNVADVRDVKAIGFCVSRAHATFMKKYFVRHGIAAEVVLGDTAIEDRQRFIRKLSDGQLQCIFTVDVFNEGVDIPSINTLLMLRPTESPVVFAQQLGRGLRHSPGKDVLTVLDFVGLHRQEFDLEQRFVQLTGTPVRALRDEVEQGFPSLAGASRIILDTVVADEVIARLKRVTASATIRSMAKELAALGETTTLGEFLDATGRDLADIYRSHNWTAVRRAAGFDDSTAAEGGPAQLIRRFTTVDDDDRLDAYAETAATIRTGGTVDVSNPWVRMFLSLMKPGWTPHEKGRREWTYAEVADVLAGHPELCDENEQVLAVARERVDHRSDRIIGPLGTTVLRSHGTYHQVELLAALQEPDAITVPATLREGVRWIDHLSTDLLFITLDKDEGAFTPSTMYRDIPVSDHLFDWESQSRTTAASPTGQRYVTSSGRSTEVLLAVRRRKTVNGSTAPYVLLGSADYVSHHGDAPMSIQWELRRAMPPEIVEYAPMSG